MNALFLFENERIVSVQRFMLQKSWCWAALSYTVVSLYSFGPEICLVRLYGVPTYNLQHGPREVMCWAYCMHVFVSAALTAGLAPRLGRTEAFLPLLKNKIKCFPSSVQRPEQMKQDDDASDLKKETKYFSKKYLQKKENEFLKIWMACKSRPTEWIFTTFYQE